MRFDRSTATWIAWAVGLACLIGNLWYALDRSTIPRSLDDRVVSRDIGREKHPGEDDVHWLVLQNEGTLHVDRPVWEGVKEGDRITKESWSDHLIVNGDRVVRLGPSEDAWGMVWVGLGGVLILVGVVGVQRGMERIGNANGK